jgi:hypothetical protein
MDQAALLPGKFRCLPVPKQHVRQESLSSTEVIKLDKYFGMHYFSAPLI